MVGREKPRQEMLDSENQVEQESPEKSEEDEASCVLAEGHFSGCVDPGYAIEELFEWEQEPIERCRLPGENALEVSPKGFTRIVTIVIKSRYWVTL